MFGQYGDLIVSACEPGSDQWCFWFALLVTKARRDESAPIDQTGVGGEDEVGDVWFGVDQLDRGSRGDERVDEPLPLCVGAVDIDQYLSMHPRIDLIRDGEIVGP